jgi:multidrug efflux pump subunit AcrB
MNNRLCASKWIARARAQLGVSQREIAENFLIASSSSVVVTPNYWNDPKTGRPYQVVVVQPHETALNSVEAVLNIPLSGKGQSPTQTLGNVATVKHVELPAIINHVNTELAFDVYATCRAGISVRWRPMSARWG